MEKQSSDIKKIRVCVNCNNVFIPIDKSLACPECNESGGTFSLSIVLADFISRHKGFAAKLTGSCCPPGGHHLIEDERQLIFKIRAA